MISGSCKAKNIVCYSWICISLLCTLCDKSEADLDKPRLRSGTGFAVSISPQNGYIQKCCSQNHFLSKNGSCTKASENVWDEKRSLMSLEKAIMKLIQTDEIGIPLGFRLVENRPVCKNGETQQLTFNMDTVPEEFHLTTSFQLAITAFQQNATLEGGNWLILDPSNFCVEWESLDTIGVKFCAYDTCQTISNEELPSSSSSESLQVENRYNDAKTLLKHINFSSSRSLCLRKCCPASKAINMTDFTCVSYDVPWHLSPLHSEGGSGRTTDDGVIDDDPLPVNWLTGLPNCAQSYEVYADKYDRYYINSDGTLVTERDGNVAETPPGEYCFDAVVFDRESYSSKENNSFTLPDPGRRAVTTTGARNDEPQDDDVDDALQFYRQMAVVCFEEDESAFEEQRKAGENSFDWRNVYTALTAISSIFLLATCLVYAILWKDLNLPGWLQFAYALALLLTFTLLTIAQLWTQRIYDISKGLCRALGYGLHFCFLSCFFFLTSMNLDLWLSFRSNALVRGFGKGRGKRRFFEFSAFSIGFPAAVTLLLFAVDSCTSSKDSSDGETPWFLPTTGIGENACVIDKGQKVAQLHYFYGFVGVLLLINLVIFVGTLISLRNREKETRMAKQQSTSSADYDSFLIMGILWIFEVISWTSEYFGVEGSIFKNIFIFTDCCNASQGVAVFLMFVWKRQTWKQLKKKLKSRFGIRGKRPLCRPSYNCTVSSGGNTATNGTSTKSSHLSSTKSTDSSRLPSTSTFTQLEAECSSLSPK